jgi:Na+/glutamate symporter
MNICCSGVKIILIDNILRTKLLWRLMTFLTVQLLFDKLSHTFLMLLFFTTYLDQKFFETYGRTPRKVTIEPIMSFREKGPKIFQ